MRRACLLLLVGLTAGPTVGQIVEQDGLRFERLFGTGDAVPGAPPGEFIAFAVDPALSGDWVVVAASSGWASEGYYVWHAGETRLLVDVHTSLPGLPEETEFLDLFSQSYSIGESGLAAFFAEAHTDSGYFPGVWGWREGSLFLVAGPGTAVPDGDGAVFDIGVNPVVAGDSIYFVGGWTDKDGSHGEVFVHSGGVLERTPLNESTALSYAALSGTGGWLTAVRAESPTSYALVRWPVGPGVPEVLLERSVEGRATVSRSGAVVAVSPDLPGYPSPPGLYRFNGRDASLVFGRGELDPHSGLPAHAGFAVGVDGSAVAYVTRLFSDQGHESLYIEGEDGISRRIIGSGDDFHGSRVVETWQLPPFFDDNRLAVGIELETETAVWLVDLSHAGPAPLTIPALGPWGLAGLAVFLAGYGLAAVRRRRSPHIKTATRASYSDLRSRG